MNAEREQRGKREGALAGCLPCDSGLRRNRRHMVVSNNSVEAFFGFVRPLQADRSTAAIDLMTQASTLRSANPLRQSKDNLVKQALGSSQPPPVEPPSDEAVRALLSKVRLHHTLGGHWFTS